MSKRLGEMQRVALIGSTSEIGLAILNRLPLAPDAEVVLVGRRRGDVHSYGNLRHKKLRFEELDMDKSFNAIDIVQSI
jgi:NAD(P)-dependent dehydrogenase (short-subunit alcohol dehydrogenase family)